MKDMKTIYEHIDKIEFNIEDYEKEMLNDMEKQILKKSLRKQIKRKVNFKKMGIITAALAFSFIIFAHTNIGKNVYAFAQSKVSEISYSIGKALGITKNIEPYTSVIGKVVENNGIEVKLTDVIIDSDRITFNTIYNTSKPVDSAFFKNIKVYINGEEIKHLSSGSNSGSIDDTNTLFYSLSYYKVEGINQIDDLEIKLVLEDLNYYIGEKNGIINGLWEFEFTANGKELAVETKNLSIDYTFEIDNQIFNLNKLEYSPVRQTITGKRKIVGEYTQSYFIQLKGKDNLGNPIIFNIKSASDDEVVFSYERVYEFLKDWSDEITSITLAPFNISTGEQLGEEFTIYLNN